MTAAAVRPEVAGRPIGAPARWAGAGATRSSLETLEALARLIQLNASGGLTAAEFRNTKAELLQRV